MEKSKTNLVVFYCKAGLFLSLVIFAWKYLPIINTIDGPDRTLASPSSQSDIICNTYDRITKAYNPRFRKDIITDKIPQKYKKNPVEVKCHWIGDDDKQRILYQMKLDNKASQMFMLVIDRNENIELKEIVPDTDSFITRKEHSSPDVFIEKYNINNGKKMRMRITTADNWPEEEKWEYSPVDYEVDEDRKLLPLKTHDGLEFYSFYYEPTKKKKYCDGSLDQKRKKEVVVLIKGGTGSYRDKSEYNNPMGSQIASFLREQGYIVLMTNYRGKKKLSNDFRLSGIGQMYNHGVKDIISALNGLAKRYDIDKSNIKIMGCSRGGQMAALFSIYLSQYTKEYKVAKTIVSSGILNPIQGALNYYKKLPDNFHQITMEEINNNQFMLDFGDYDWMGDSLCPKRPHGIYTDNEWKKILEFDQYKGKRYLDKYPNLDQKTCKYSTYQKNSPAHNIINLQSDLLALAGYNEYGNTSPFAPLEFKRRDKSKKTTAVLHPFGHCIGLDNSGWEFKKKIFSDFLNGCEEEISDEQIKKLKEKIKTIYSCMEKYFIDKDSDLNRIKSGYDTKYFLSINDLEALLTTYENDFLVCKNLGQRCRWQAYQNYLSLFESYKKIVNEPSNGGEKLKNCIVN